MNITKRILSLKNHSVRFYRFLFSYVLIIVLILAFLGSVVYSTFVRTLAKEIESSNLTKLTQIRDSVDSNLRSMERIAVQIAGNRLLSPYITTEGGYDSLNAVSELRKYRSTNSFVQDIMVYYIEKDKQRVYSATGIFDIDTYFGRQYQYNGWGHLDFLKLVEETQIPSIRPSEAVKINGVYYEELAMYIYPLPINSIKPYEAITILFKTNELKSMLKTSLQDHNGYGFIINEKDELIAFSEVEDNYERDAEEVLKEIRMKDSQRPVSTVEIGNEHFSVVKVRSEYSGWSYLLVMPTNQFMQKVYDNRDIFNFIVISILICGFGVSILFVNKNYGPVEKLAEGLKSQRFMENSQGRTDEIYIISQIINDVNKENRGLISQLKTQTSIVREQFLLKLLKGKIEEPYNVAMMDSVLGVKFDGDDYAVMLFLIDDYAHFEQSNTKNMQDMLRYSIVNVIEELALEVGCGYGIDLANDYGIVLLLNITIQSDVERRLAELAYRAKDFFKENFGFSLSVGISNVYQDISITKDYFIQASDSAYYRFVKGKDRVIFFKDIKSIVQNNYWYPVQEEMQLVMAIKQGKIQEIEKIIRDITNNMVNQDFSLEMVRGICIGVINTVQKTFVEIDISSDISFGAEIEDLLSLKFETIGIFKKYMVNFCEKLCRYIESQKESKNFKLRDKVIGYVRDNYKDSSISVESIAEEFSLSPSYMTRFFKDHTGYSLKQYIDMLKTDHAKYLLKNTRLTLKEILQEVGYLDDTNFIRKFKKETGMTPIQFRNVSKETLALREGEVSEPSDLAR